MKAFLILPIMFFLHVLADFHLQGILAKLKQKENWKKVGSKYANDYKIALINHSFEWIFVVSLPMLLDSMKRINVGGSKDIWSIVLYFAIIAANMGIHYTVDDMKANDHEINLTNDQSMHLIQIFIAWITWTVLIGWI